MEQYLFDKPEGWSDDKWEDLCSALDNCLDNFITDYGDGEDTNA